MRKKRSLHIKFTPKTKKCDQTNLIKLCNKLLIYRFEDENLSWSENARHHRQLKRHQRQSARSAASGSLQAADRNPNLSEVNAILPFHWVTILDTE